MSLTIFTNSFVLIRTEEIMPPLSFKQFSSFSQACHFVHQNMGHSVRLRVYNCCCFQLSRPELANPEPQSLAMYTTFLSSLNISIFVIHASFASPAWITSHLVSRSDKISLTLLNIWVTVHQCITTF